MKAYLLISFKMKLLLILAAFCVVEEIRSEITHLALPKKEVIQKNPCSLGETYLIIKNNGSVCRRCSTCGRTAVEMEKCTLTNDTRCSCIEKDHFFSNLKGTCLKCKTCGAGQGEIKGCSYYSNRKCKPCDKGFFSSTVNGPCHKCGRCRYRVSVPCNRTRDVVCIPDPNPGNTIIQAIVIGAFASVGIMVCGLIVCTYYMKPRWCNSRCSATASRPLDRNVLEASPNFQENEDRVPALARYAANPDTSMPVHDLPAEVIDQLSLKLNGRSEKNWRHLASRMGCDLDFIRCMETVPLEATPKLLSEFSTKGNQATVGCLFNFLLDIERYDAAIVLLPYLPEDINPAF